MRRTILTAAFLICSTLIHAQSPVESVLREIEANNPSLKAARFDQQAGEYENKADILLDDPEIEFNYLWGNEGVRRHDISISQSFDYALLSGQRSKLAAGRNSLLAYEYRAMRQEVLLEAEKICIDLVYNNALESELKYHLSNAETLVSAYERKVELGESSVLEMNNARLHHTDIKGRLGKVQLEKNRLLLALSRLNGGQDLSFTLDSFLALGLRPVSSDFETFFDDASQASPAVNYAKGQMEVSKAELKLDKSAWVPGISIGYMAEIAQPEAYRGLTLGVSIPLWRNASKVNQSKARYAASQLRKDDAVQQFYYDLLSLYNEAAGLRRIAEDYRGSLDSSDNRSLLFKAEQQGEISMIEYITEVDLYYENLDETLAAERDYHMALAELTSVLL